jgi:TRAP-type transport system small permease protein
VSCWLKIGRGITTLLYVIASLGLLVAMVAVVINVLGRLFFGTPLLGTVEIVGLSGVFLIPLSMALTQRKRAHIDVAMLAGRLSKHTQLLLAIGTCLLVLLTTALLVWGGVGLLEDALTRPDMVTPVLRLPKAPFISVWIVGCVFVFAYFLQHLIEIVTKAGKE